MRVIASDADAYEWVRQYLSGTPDLSGLELKGGWPHLRIRLTGAKFHNSMTPTVMKGFVDFQNSLYRSYSIAKYGTPDLRKLLPEERESLELVVEMEEGSSIFEIDFQELLVKLTEQVGTKMEPQHLIILIIGVGLLWAGQSSYKAYLANRKQTRLAELTSEERKAEIKHVETLSREETERTRLIAQLARREPLVRTLAQQSFDAKTDLLKALSVADVVEIDGVEIEGSVIRELVTNARRRSDSVKLNGPYQILRVDTSIVGEFRVRIKYLENGTIVEAKVKDSALTPGWKNSLQEAEWGRTPIYLKVAARVVDDEVRNAEIIGIGRDESGDGD